MANADAVAEFEQGVDLLQSGDSAGAIEYFRNAVEAEKRNPYYLSFLGLAVARAQKKWAAASQLCEAALRYKPDEPQFYLNLAEVYTAGNRRKDAIHILASARKRFRRNSPIRREKAGLRQRAPKPAFAEPNSKTIEFPGEFLARTGRGMHVAAAMELLRTFHKPAPPGRPSK